MGQCLLNRLARRVHRSDPDTSYQQLKSHIAWKKYALAVRIFLDINAITMHVSIEKEGNVMELHLDCGEHTTRISIWALRFVDGQIN